MNRRAPTGRIRFGGLQTYGFKHSRGNHLVFRHAGFDGSLCLFILHSPQHPSLLSSYTAGPARIAACIWRVGQLHASCLIVPFPTDAECEEEDDASARAYCSQSYPNVYSYRKARVMAWRCLRSGYAKWGCSALLLHRE
jgi:hypothetical protein